MDIFQDKVQLLNNMSYKYVRTSTHNSNKVSDTCDFGERLNLNRNLIYTLKLDSFYNGKTLLILQMKIKIFYYSTASGAP